MYIKARGKYKGKSAASRRRHRPLGPPTMRPGSTHCPACLLASWHCVGWRNCRLPVVVASLR